MGAAQDYFNQTTELLNRLRDTQIPQIEAAAEICAERIARGGLVFLFGAGHSRMMCEEMTPRQGGFVGFVALVELAVSNHSAIVGSNGLRGPLHLEKYEGSAEELLKSYRFGPNDAFILISTSGIRPLIVEMAMGAKERGLPVIGVVSRPHCENSPPAHSSGKKLIDLAEEESADVRPVLLDALENPLFGLLPEPGKLGDPALARRLLEILDRLDAELVPQLAGLLGT